MKVLGSLQQMWHYLRHAGPKEIFLFVPDWPEPVF